MDNDDSDDDDDKMTIAPMIMTVIKIVIMVRRRGRDIARQDISVLLLIYYAFVISKQTSSHEKKTLNTHTKALAHKPIREPPITQDIGL